MSFSDRVLPFIFSWKGQYDNAVNLEKNFSEKFGSVVVINSDDNNTPEHWVNIGDSCYFSDQFRKCLEIFSESDKEFLWHIQADASLDSLDEIISSAENAYNEYTWGVFAPNVDDTFYISQRTDVMDIKGSLKLVATPDNTCWIIHRDIINTMLDNLNLMVGNRLGWGWDLLICSFAHKASRKVIRDYSITIDHPKSTGYMKDEAEIEMQKMFDMCSNDIKELIYYIKMNPKMLSKYHKSDMIVIDTQRTFL